MSVRLRLTRMGRKKRPYYRIVAVDSRRKRDGAFIENLGHYHPLEDPPTVKVDADKALKWLRVGAQPSDTVRSLLRREGIWLRFRLEKRGLPESQIEGMMTEWFEARSHAKAEEPAEGTAEAMPEILEEPVGEPEAAAAEEAGEEKAEEEVAATPESPEESVTEPEAAAAEEAGEVKAEEAESPAEPDAESKGGAEGTETEEKPDVEGEETTSDEGESKEA